MSFAFAILIWLIFLQSEQALPNHDGQVTKIDHLIPSEATVDPAQEFGATTSELEMETQLRTEESSSATAPDVVISGVVVAPIGCSNSDLRVRLIARPWNRGQSFEPGASWEFANTVQRFKSIPLQADGSFEFRSRLKALHLDSIWRVEVEYSISQEALFPAGDLIVMNMDAAGRSQRIEAFSAGGAPPSLQEQSASLPLGHSPTFRILEESPEHQLFIEPNSPVEIVQEYRGFNALGHDSLLIRLGLDDPKLRSSNQVSLTRESAASANQASFELRVLLSNAMQGRDFSLSVDFQGASFPYSVNSNAQDLIPGLNLLDPIDLPALGVIEVRIPNISRDAQLNDRSESPELGIGVLPWKSTKTVPDYLNFTEHPWGTERQFQRGLGPTEPSPGAWDGADYVTRIGWIPVGEYTLTGEWEGNETGGAPTKFRPQRIFVRPWQVTEVTAKWLDDLVSVQISPSPAPEPGDEYVISAFALDSQGVTHPLGFGLQFVSLPVQVPRDTVEIAVITQFTHDDLYRWSCYHARVPASGVPAQLELRREGSIQQVPLADLPREESNYAVCELRPPAQVWGGQPLRFYVQQQAMLEIVGFPTGSYQLWSGGLARDQVFQMQFWQDLQLGK